MNLRSKTDATAPDSANFQSPCRITKTLSPPLRAFALMPRRTFNDRYSQDPRFLR